MKWPACGNYNDLVTHSFDEIPATAPSPDAGRRTPDAFPAPPPGFAQTLRALAADPARHAKFVNTLSLMEYIGARKILKSQPAAGISAELLAHVSEEIRHAHALKKLALRLDPLLTGYEPNQLLAGKSASGYMQAIDRQAEADLKSMSNGNGENERLAWINYLYTTLLVEERAGSFYPEYASLLAELFPAAGHAAVIHGIIREEESHLRQVVDHLLQDDPDGRARLERLRPVEAKAFADWIGGLSSGA